MTDKPTQVVYVCVWSGDFPTAVNVFPNPDLAEKWRQQIAKDHWDDEFGPNESKPEDPKALADLYFEKLGEDWTFPETFEVHVETVKTTYDPEFGVFK